MAKMRYILTFSALIVFLITSCSKQKFSSTPSLKLESVNTTVLQHYGLLIFKFSFTDAEGDFSDTTNMYIQKVVPNCAASGFEQFYVLPAFPSSKDQKGTINVSLSYDYPSGNYQSLKSPQCQQSDTATFRFVLRDNANHASDTVSSPRIVIVY